MKGIDVTTTTATPAPPVATAAEIAEEATPDVAPVRTRRKSSWLFAAIAVVLVGAIGGAFLYNAASSSTDVFVASGNILRGATITESDLTTIAIADGQSTAAVPTTDVESLIGMTASTDIPEGGLITQESVGGTLTVPAGRALVGLNLASSQMPAQKLTAGDEVMLVPVANQAAGAVEIDADSAIPAVVSQVSYVTEATGVVGGVGGATTVIDVYVTAQVAPTVTSQAAAGTLALYLVPAAESTSDEPADDAGEDSASETEGES